MDFYYGPVVIFLHQSLVRLFFLLNNILSYILKCFFFSAEPKCFFSDLIDDPLKFYFKNVPTIKQIPSHFLKNSMQKNAHSLINQIPQWAQKMGDSAYYMYTLLGNAKCPMGTYISTFVLPKHFLRHLHLKILIER